ncbi:hypothetical protein HAX54_017067 [Datura stramonium]|uniref:Uncharacterized protein n=1 Tax=Datura stramonium TaxID=4076 RepID=A0ABS8UM96_DATST|nr:hypothetical protein [Datura stramonium]
MDGDSFLVEESKDQLPISLKRKRNARTKKLEFVGWGSRPLIEFLQSIGKDTSRAYSQQEVTAIVTEYVNSNDLLNPQKKKRVLCDARLYSLFGKKSIPRMKIYDLLEVHFSENHDESEDEPSDSSEEEDIVIASKGRRSTGSPKKKVPVAPKSCFAAVIAENIKLVYLKRSLVQGLLKTPGSFEDKVVGSFVRVKSDPNDYSQKNSHQLQQVEGVKKVLATSDATFEIHLQLSNMMKDIPVSSLSDDDFYEVSNCSIIVLDGSDPKFLHSPPPLGMDYGNSGTSFGKHLSGFLIFAKRNFLKLYSIQRSRNAPKDA